eukprot:Gb_16760 [translate_table: standard]
MTHNGLLGAWPNPEKPLAARRRGGENAGSKEVVSCRDRTASCCRDGKHNIGILVGGGRQMKSRLRDCRETLVIVEMRVDVYKSRRRKKKMMPGQERTSMTSQRGDLSELNACESEKDVIKLRSCLYKGLSGVNVEVMMFLVDFLAL